jgi:hypothetical protein
MKAAMLTALGEPGEAITILTALIQSHEVDQTGVPFPFHFCMAEPLVFCSAPKRNTSRLFTVASKHQSVVNI